MKTSRKIKLTLEQAREMYGKDETMDKLLLANFPELGVKKVGKWEDLEFIDGWFVDSQSRIVAISKRSTYDSNINIFATESQAKSALAAAQLSQLMKHVNGDWVADWDNSKQLKYTIERFKNNLKIKGRVESYQFIALCDSAIADQFLSDHEQLIKTYFEL